QIVEDLPDRRKIRLRFSIADHQQLQVDRSCRTGSRENLSLCGLYCGREKHQDPGENGTKPKRLIHNHTSVHSEIDFIPRLGELYGLRPTRPVPWRRM